MDKRVVVVDVDGVLCDFVGMAIPAINDTFKCQLKKDDVLMYDMDKVVGVQKDDFNQIFRQLEYSKMKVIEGASEGLKKLASEFQIVIGTSRPVAIHDITKKWLDENQLLYHSFMTHNADKSIAEKKSDLYSRAYAVIDDDITEVIAASESVKVACLFDSPWNHSINAKGLFHRCKNWHEVVMTCLSI